MKEFPWEERYKVHEWMVSHPHELEQFINEWVAVSINGIVAHGKSLLEIADSPNVKREMEKNPVVFSKMPDPNYHHIYTTTA
ncbi:MAG: hypothetical protein Q8R15_02015 [Candidatus Micrarchaeota archaeon]|nr:hypothetical protein [Candidatus Micrarchaeota archaeon]